MKNFTHTFKLMISGLLVSGSLTAQELIYSENFNNELTTGKWVASAKPTQWNATGEQNGWEYENCAIVPDQKAANDGSTGVIVLNHTGASGLVFPVTTTTGIGDAVIVAQFQPSGKDHSVGPDGDCLSNLLLQKKVNDSWVTVHTVSAKNENAGKAYKYTLPIDDTDVSALRISYTSDPEGCARLRIYDVSLYQVSVKAAQWHQPTNITDNGFTLNWEAGLLAKTYEVVVAKRAQEENVELVTEGSAEAESSLWMVEGAVARSTERAASGNFSWKLDGTDALARVCQNIPVEAGSRIDISLKGWVESNSTTDKEMRLWGQFLKEDGSLALASPHLSGNDAYKNVSSDWVPMEVTGLLVPEDAVSMDLDFRTQPGVIAYVDDFTVTGTSVCRTPVAQSPFNTTSTFLEVDELEPGQEYSIYLYAIDGENKARSKELIVKTTGVASAIGNKESDRIRVLNRADALRIEGITDACKAEVYTISGQLSATCVITNEAFEIQLPSGAYLIKFGQKVLKVIR
ncbi:MAG: hypothetical protein ACRCSQ_00660 [Bacteroidales bacterium]